MQDDDGIRNISKLIREKEIWNEAIECAMKQFIDNQIYYGYDVYKLIRKLKK